MITICARWESDQMPAELERRMWRQIRGAFQADESRPRIVLTPIVDGLGPFDQYATMEEALESCQGHKIYLEPNADEILGPSYKWPEGDFTLVLGNTGSSNQSLIDQFPGSSVKISTPGATDLYGTNAASIALAFWWNR